MRKQITGWWCLFNTLTCWESTCHSSVVYEIFKHHLFRHVCNKEAICSVYISCPQAHWLQCNFISQEVLQADIKLNACHCDKGFSNLLCTKACKPTGAADVLMEEDDTTSLVSVTYYNNTSAWMLQIIFICVMRHSHDEVWSDRMIKTHDGQVGDDL